MMVTPHSHLRKVGKKVVWRNLGKQDSAGWKEGGHADYEGMVLLGQQDVAPCVQVFEWGLCTKGLRMVAGFWAGIPVEITQEAGLILRCRRAAIGSPF